MKVNSVLGLDIGVASVGWCLLEHGSDGPKGIAAAGVRVFPAGLNLTDTARGESRNLERRAARQRRRQLMRRVARRRAACRILQEVGALPAGKPSHGDPDWKNILDDGVYTLRAAALDRALTPTELGRIFYHMAHRRGFLSNRKSPLKKDEKPGEVKREIDELGAEIQSSGSRTLGEYLSRLNPHERRIRSRRTLRKWYRDEFEMIWAAQVPHHGAWMNDGLKERITRALFYQRPLKKQKHLVGWCSLEPKKRRTAAALLEPQRARLLQDVNHLRVIEENGAERGLTPQERTLLLAELDRREEWKFTSARRKLKMHGESRFNFETAGRETLIGNSTAARIRKVIGDKWDNADTVLKDKLINDLMSCEDTDMLAERAKQRLGLEDADAEEFSRIQMEEGYSAFSMAALRKLLPQLEAGLSVAEAIGKAYPDRPVKEMVDQLPPLDSNLRSPLVQRSLGELRRVVNAVIKKYGRPDLIRIELARDLKRSADNREDAWRAMRKRQADRVKAAEQIVRETGQTQPKDWEIERVMLANECGWECPYTGRRISMGALLSEESLFDVEHIIPFSRSLDNSFANKTLCDADYNRRVKVNRTPWEAAGQTPEWDAMVQRAKRFAGDYREPKVRRFLSQNIPGEDGFLEEFSNRDLAVTQYAARLAADYVGQLFPGEERKRRVQVSSGKATAYLRSAWRLNRLLNNRNIKSRDDHRHHAVDAAVVALTTPSTVKSLTRAVVRGRAGAFDDLPEPWPDFLPTVKKALDGIVVSHRVDRGVNGQLHAETFYGVIRDPENPKETRAVLKTRLDALTEADIKKNMIVDAAVRKAVHDKLNELGKPPKDAFQDRKNHPWLQMKNGRRVQIHRVRVFQNVEPVAISANDAPRLVKLANNHHLEVFEVPDNKKGGTAWKGEIVSLFEARRRLMEGKPVVAPRNKDGHPLLFSLAIGDAVELTVDESPSVYVVQKLAAHDYNFRPHSDARMVKEARDLSIRIQSDSGLKSKLCRKISLDAIGQAHVSRD